MPAVEPAAPDGEAHAWETAHEPGADAAPACPGNGRDPGALPAFLRRTA